jgi:hypothetical protein
MDYLICQALFEIAEFFLLSNLKPIGMIPFLGYHPSLCHCPLSGHQLGLRPLTETQVLLHPEHPTLCNCFFKLNYQHFNYLFRISFLYLNYSMDYLICQVLFLFFVIIDEINRATHRGYHLHVIVSLHFYDRTGNDTHTIVLSAQTIFSDEPLSDVLASLCHCLLPP